MKNILKFAGAVIVVLMSCITLVFAAGQAGSNGEKSKRIDIKK